MKVGPLLLNAAALVLPLSVLEAILLHKLNGWYFSLGPALHRFTATAGGAWRPEDFVSSVSDLDFLVVRKVGDDTVLVRRRTIAWPFPFELGPFWGPRMMVRSCRGDGAPTVQLEVRYTLCWPLFLIYATLTLVGVALYALVTSDAAGALFWLALAGVIAAYLYHKALNAKGDARRAWDLVKRSIESRG